MLGGTVIPPKLWHDTPERLPVRSWQVLQRADDALQVLLVGMRDPGLAAPLADDLRRAY